MSALHVKVCNDTKSTTEHQLWPNEGVFLQIGSAHCLTRTAFSANVSVRSVNPPACCFSGAAELVSAVGVETVCQSLMGQALHAEQRSLSAAAAERLLLEQFGRHLAQMVKKL